MENINIIAIDPSLISSAVVIYNNKDLKLLNYCRETDTMSKKGLKKWFKMAEQYIDYRYIKYRDFDNYSDGEIIKVKDYDHITDIIINDIKKYINPDLDTIIGIEGYNFGAQVGDLVDLVAFSTLLRKKLFDHISENIIVLSPSTLKLEACKLTYKPEEKHIGGKNPRIEYKWRNHIGISGGSFKKPEMYLTIIENEYFDDYWYEHCLSVKEDILSVKSINKPYEDINDAYLIYRYIRHSI